MFERHKSVLTRAQFRFPGFRTVEVEPLPWPLLPTFAMPTHIDRREWEDVGLTQLQPCMLIVIHHSMKTSSCRWFCCFLSMSFSTCLATCLSAWVSTTGTSTSIINDLMMPLPLWTLLSQFQPRNISQPEKKISNHKIDYLFDAKICKAFPWIKRFPLLSSTLCDRNSERFRDDIRWAAVVSEALDSVCGETGLERGDANQIRFH